MRAFAIVVAAGVSIWIGATIVLVIWLIASDNVSAPSRFIDWLVLSLPTLAALLTAGGTWYWLWRTAKTGH